MQSDDKYTPPCELCAIQWQRKDTQNWVYFAGKLYCSGHKYAKQWLETAIALAKLEFELIQNYNIQQDESESELQNRITLSQFETEVPK